MEYLQTLLKLKSLVFNGIIYVSKDVKMCLGEKVFTLQREEKEVEMQGSVTLEEEDVGVDWV